MSNLANEKSYPGFYAIIPADVRYSKKLEPNAKLLYGEITALANISGYAWASNKYFQDLYDVDESTIQRWLKSLKDANFINVEIEKRGMITTRKIWIKKIDATPQKCGDRHLKNEGVDTLKKRPIIIHSSSTTEKQQQAASAAAAVPSKKAKEEREVYDCLKKIDIPKNEKVWITRRYDEETVKNAIAWSTSPQTKITTTLTQAIKWACSERPEMPLDSKAAVQDNKALAKRYDGVINEYAQIFALNKHVEITPFGSQSQPTCIEYTEKDFATKFQEARVKYRFANRP